MAWKVSIPPAAGRSLEAIARPLARLARPLGHLRRWARRAADTLPPTGRGLAVALLGSFALWRWGYGQMDLLLFVISLSGLVLFALACLTVSGCAVYLTRRLKRTPRGGEGGEGQLPRLETGSPIPTGFSTPALARVPLVKIGWRWRSPRGMDCRQRLRAGRLEEEVVAGRRALVHGIEREIVVRDAFGLCRVAWTRRSDTRLEVLPHVGRLGNLPAVTSFASAEGLPHPSGAPDGDRMDMRRYVPGDSVRHILWKTYARTRQLNVRVPERAIDPSDRTVAYLLSGPGDEAAAAAARVMLESGRLGPDWLFAADGSPEPTDQVESALAAIARSGSWRPNEPGREAGRKSEEKAMRARDAHRPDDPGPQGGPQGSTRRRGRSTDDDPAAGLRAFLGHPEIRGEVHCVVFAAARPGPWVDRALDAARGFGGAVSFVLGTDGVLTGEPPPFWHRLLFADPGEAPLTSSEALRGLIGTLESSHHPVLVVDRRSGRSHGRLDPRAGLPARKAG